MSAPGVPAQPTEPTEPAQPTETAQPAGPVRQSLVLVLPTTAEYDSRTYRIASSAAARGHDVTVLARLAPGLATDERHPAGYRIRRVPVSAVSGLPLPASMIRRLERRQARRRRERVASTGLAAAQTDPPGESPAPAADAGRGTGGIVRRTVGAVWRIAAIALTVRSQTRASRAVDPAADLYHGMAYMGVPIALDLGRRHQAPVVYDARDIYLEARNLARLPWPARRSFGWAERRWARRAARVMTVNQPYADVMRGRFGVEPLVVMNCSYRRDIPTERPWLLHDAIGLARTGRVVLYHGGLAPERGIDELIEAVLGLADDVHVALLGYGPLEEPLRRRAAAPSSKGRVHVLPAVPPQDLIRWVASADVVAMPIQPTTLNHRLTTPNKLFEALTAGVPVVASDLPGMAPIVRETGCGAVCDPRDVSSIATAISSILDLPPEAYRALRGRTAAAARDRYSWESQFDVLLAEYTRLTGRAW